MSPLTTPPTPSSPPPTTNNELSDDSFSYFQECRRPYNRLEDTDDSITYEIREDEGPDEDNADTDVLKYVDDFLGTEKIALKNGYTIFTTATTKRMLHAKASQNFYNTVHENASRIRMSVNSKKTQMVAISSTGEEVTTFFRTVDGETITSQPELKLLGFVFGNKPSVQPHVTHMCAKFRSRVWVL